MDLICKCGSKNLYTETKGTQTGIYCADCGKWLKWATKEDIRLLEHNKPNTVELLQAMREEMYNKLYGIPDSTAFTWQDLGINMCIEIVDKYIEKAKGENNV